LKKEEANGKINEAVAGRSASSGQEFQEQKLGSN
jgi:hypothetical protein